MHINEDGAAEVVTGNPDIGGSRASMAMMAAETLGIDLAKVKPLIGNTAFGGYSFLTGGLQPNSHPVIYLEGRTIFRLAFAVVTNPGINNVRVAKPILDLSDIRLVRARVAGRPWRAMSALQSRTLIR